MGWKDQSNKQKNPDERARVNKILEKFPGGVAEVKAITTYVERPMHDPPWTEMDHKRPLITGIPFPCYEQVGGTHPVSGAPETKKKIVEMKIWPLSGRTDRFSEVRRYSEWVKPPNPVALDPVLNYLLKKENGYGTYYVLLPVPKEQIEIEETAAMDPASAQVWRQINKDFRTNDQIAADSLKAPAVRRETGHVEEESSDPEFEEASSLVEEFAE